MNQKLLLFIVTIVTWFFLPGKAIAQAPTLGTTADYILFTSNGAVSNSGVSQYTGNVGAKIGAITGFGNVNGQIHAGDGSATQASTDLLSLYGDLDAAVSDSTLPAIIGNGDTLKAGVYYIPQPGTLSATLYLDAKGDSNAVFIFQVDGTFSSNTNAKMKLLNGAQSCRIFWKIEGAVTLSTGTNMKGTIVANKGAITLNTNDTLDGRALSTTGAILFSVVHASIPIGCGSPVLNGPAAPILASTACYTIFSSNGSIINTGISYVTGDIGSNTGSATGFDSLNVIGKIHKSPDPSTSTCSSDLTAVFNYLGTLTKDIELMSPALFGRNLVLTPHVYLLNSATILTDTLYLDAQNNPYAVFVIKIVGAFSTSTYSRVKLLNDAQPKNIYWHIVGAASINDYSNFYGTIVCSGAINLKIGTVINGRTLTTGGAVNTVAINAVMPPGCGPVCPDITTDPISKTLCAGASASFTVVATGDSLFYQWRKGNTVLGNTGAITGANTATLTINPTNVSDSSANYTVIVLGSCAVNDTSAKFSLVVNPLPAAAGTISGPISVCQNQGGYQFKVPVIAGASTYNWILPAGATITNGAASNTVTVFFSAVAVGGNVTVQGVNACGNGTTSLNFSIVVSAGAAGNAAAISGTTPVCQGQTGVTYSVPVITNAVVYLWTLPAGANITSGDSTKTILVTFSASAVSGNITVQGSNSCGNGTVSAPFAVSVNLLPGTPGIISGNTPVCQNQSDTYSVPAVANATSYLWTLPSGASITAGATTNNITVAFSGSALSGDLSVQGLNSCGSGVSSALYPINVATVPTLAGPINGPISTCQNQGGYLYSAPALADANSYSWIVPTGATITAGMNTNSITVSFDGSAISGNIAVQGNNSCGSGPVSAPFSVVVSSSGAGNAGTISGPAAVCQGQSGVVYTVPVIVNAVTYTWILPSGASITSGANTNSITVAFSAAAQPGNITVQGGNSCGSGAVSVNFAITTSPLPATPGLITGISPVCPNQNGYSYSVSLIANATSYVWTVPSGATISSGATTNSITVDFSGSAVSGNITVSGVNSCGIGPVSQPSALTVTPLPAAAGTISGPVSACQNQSGFIYSVPAIANATSYSWTVPAGATINSGATTNSVSVSFSGIAMTGNITVQGVNNCGNGTSSNIFIVIVSSAGAGNAGTISGNQTVCQLQTGVVYTVPVISNAVLYDWILPAGASITSGFNTNSITVTLGNTAISGNITVQGSNSCGTGAISAPYPIVVNNIPAASAAIAGPASVCQNQNGNVYTVPVIANATSYQWTVPTGASITSVTTGRAITVSFSGSAQSGNITVQGINSCGSGVSATFGVTVNQTPSVDPVNNQALCANTATNAVTFSGSVSGSSFNWSNNTTSIGLAANGSGNINSFTAINSGSTPVTATITVTAVNNSCPGAPTTFTILVNPASSCSGVDISITKTVNTTAPVVGQVVVFTLVATNSGSLDATGVVVTDLLKSGYTYISSSSSNFNPSTGEWTIGTLAAGTSQTLTIDLRVNPTGDYLNAASIRSNEAEADVANNSSSAATFPVVFKVPAGFSPNGDGVNDLFVIRGIENFPANSFQVFNRWGDPVYEMSAYNSTWNGSSNKGIRVGNDELPVGTYFYVLNLGNGSSAYKGTIYLSK